MAPAGVAVVEPVGPDQWLPGAWSCGWAVPSGGADISASRFPSFSELNSGALVPPGFSAFPFKPESAPQCALLRPVDPRPCVVAPAAAPTDHRTRSQASGASDGAFGTRQSSGVPAPVPEWQCVSDEATRAMFLAQPHPQPPPPAPVFGPCEGLHPAEEHIAPSPPPAAAVPTGRTTYARLSVAGDWNALTRVSYHLGWGFDRARSVVDPTLTRLRALRAVVGFMKACAAAGVTEVVLYYAGHGAERTGDWVMADGRVTFKQIESAFGLCRAPHQSLHVICDCCYAGAWLKPAAASRWPIAVTAAVAADRRAVDGSFSPNWERRTIARHNELQALARAAAVPDGT